MWHPVGNSNVVYALIQEKDLFLKLNKLSLPSLHTPLSSTKSAVVDLDTLDEEAKCHSESNRGPHMVEESAPQPTRKSNQTFVPTPQWVSSWKKKLPLITVLRLLKHLLPQVPSSIYGNVESEANVFFVD